MIHKIVFSAIVTLLYNSCFAQGNYETTALNRITLNRNDTITQFFISAPQKKFNPSPYLFYHWFAPDTIISTQGAIGGKLLHGQLRIFYPNKNLKVEGYYVQGLKSGVWKFWKEDGSLIKKEKWEKGKPVALSDIPPGSDIPKTMSNTKDSLP